MGALHDHFLEACQMLDDIIFKSVNMNLEPGCSLGQYKDWNLRKQGTFSFFDMTLVCVLIVSAVSD